MYDLQETVCLDEKEKTGSIESNVLVMLALSDALAVAAEHTGTAVDAMKRIYNNARKRAVEEAVLHELVQRHNNAIASGVLKASPRLPADHLANAMSNARRSARSCAIECGLLP